MDPSHERPEHRASWPYASLFFFGFFGMSTPEGRRLAWRTTAALGLFVAAGTALRSGIFGPVATLLWAFALPAAVAGIGFAYARYLSALDELSRAIQLKAFAFAYGSAMVLLAVAMADALVRVGAAGNLTPGMLVFGIILAEPLRGVALVYLAQKYE